ncbi:MAG TPA: M28 family peptidase [Gemmataceae bacterium]|nr:M28 family peptidase [Gemmataceae bacterium]
MAWWHGWRRRQLWALAGLLLLLGSRLLAANQDVLERMRKDVAFLASDECEGRGIKTKGINLAADYIASEFRQAGLKPAGPDGSYFQPFTMRSGSSLGSPNTLILRGPLGQEIELKQGEHFQVLGLSSSANVTAALAFAGYGATAKDQGYDDYAGIDAAGKAAIVVRKTPRFENRYAPFDGRSAGYHAAISTKAGNAEEHHAAALILVNDRATAEKEDSLIDFSYTAQENAVEMPVLQLRRAVVDAILSSSLGRSLLDLEQAIDRDLQPRSSLLAGWTVSLEVHVNRPGVPVKNIVGVLEGAGPLANQTVVLGAHYDHLGYGSFGSLARSRNERGGAIHHGADDNGSGTTALIELARRFGQIPNRQGRRLVFIAFTGEESGLFGSAHYCKHPLFPLADTVAMINMDMVGRLRPDRETHKDKLIVYGTGSAPTFDALLESLNKKYDFKFQKEPGGEGPSDQQTFYLKNIPVLFFFTGEHPDYHKPTDTADKINVPGMARVTDLVEDVAADLATVPDRPKFVKVPRKPGSGMRMRGPSLGIMPEYGAEGDGVLVSGVLEGRPAAKAGLQQGDRIVELAGKTVKNLEGYMALMAGHKGGDVLEVGILRDGKKLTLKVTLE